jgi:predicted histidine transporter YuiF (NhaC family)
MFQKYKEILFGLAFGIGAVFIDTGMDAMTDGNSLMDEVAEHPRMMLYRTVFIVLGLALGWLLWQRNRRERRFRQLDEALRRVQQEIGTQALLFRATLQTLLIRDDLHLSDAASKLVQEAYQRSQELQRISEQKLPPVDGE